MKNKIISLIAIIATLAVMIFATVKVNNNITEVGVQKAKTDETVQGDTGNQTGENQTSGITTYSVSMILNQIDKADKVNMGGNKVSITSENPNVTFEIYDAVTGSEITADQISEVVDDVEVTTDVYAIPVNGARMQISGIKEGERNNLIIENKETVENYVNTFKKLTVEVDSSDIASVRVAIKNITKLINGEEVTTAGSEEETAIFIYQENDGTVKINNNEDLKIYYVFVANSELPEGKTGLTDEELEEKEWTEYNKETGYKAEKNGILYSKTKYKDGAYSSINNYIVNNVDKLAPIITLNDVEYNTEEYTAKISGTIKEADTTKDYVKSGLVGYAITMTDEEPENYLDFSAEDAENETKNIELDNIDINGNYYVWSKDKAGNVSKKVIEVDIDFTSQDEELKRVLILNASNAELIGTTYVSINEMLEALEANNITADSGKVVAQIVNPIKSETVEFDNVDIELDLNGYEITGRVQEPTIKVESGKVTVIDNKYDIADYISDAEKVSELKELYHANEGNGKIDSLHDVAIDIKENGEFTLGHDNSQGYAYIDEPNQNTPFVKGKLKGVYNENGVFNYYDGKIESISTVDGNVSKTPNLFDPTVVAKEGEEGIYVEVLERVSGIEALIGKTRYTKLEDAIAAANDIKGTPDEQVEIDVVTDLSKSESVIVDNTKNILIDLNGFKFTNSLDDYVIKNYGKLEITAATENAKIYSSTHNVIYNASDAKLVLNGVNGELTKETGPNDRGAIVYNDVFADLEIKDGNFVTTNTYAYVVYNRGGAVDVSGGYFDTNKDAYYLNEGQSTVIYNDDALENRYDENDIDISLNQVQKGNDEYYFELNDDNELVSNNSVNASIANSYIKLDLTEYPNDKNIQVIVNAEYTGRTWDDIGYATITKSTDIPTYDNTNGRFIYACNPSGVEAKEYYTDVMGGEIYYLHFGYRCRTAGSYFKINSVKINDGKFPSGKLTISGGEYNGAYTLWNNSNYDDVVINDGIFKTNTVLHNYRDNGEITINGGKFETLVLNRSTGKITVNGGEFKDRVYNMASGTIHVTGGIIDTIESEVGNGNQALNNGWIYIEGGIINNVKNATQDLTIKNALITGTVYPRRNVTVNIENTEFRKAIGNMYVNFSFIQNDTDSDINIKDVNMYVDTLKDYPNIKAINNAGSGNINAENLNIQMINHASNYDANNKANLVGIYNESDGNIEITGKSSIITNKISDTNNTIDYAIYNVGTGSITIGTKDGVYNENDITIASNKKAIETPRGQLNLYDGTISSNEEVNVSLHDKEIGYYVVTDGTKEITVIDGDKNKTLNTDKVSEEAKADYAKLGDGYAIITDLTSNQKYEFEYKGEEDVFTAPQNGNYRLEVWGAQGGVRGENSPAYGAYATGIVTLNANDNLYINVGGRGLETAGGYNGGGNPGDKNDQTGSGGGGATHIALSSGVLTSLYNKVDDVLIVAAGAGGKGTYQTAVITEGSNGGGYYGGNGFDGYHRNITQFVGMKATGNAGGYSNDDVLRGIGLFGRGGNFCNNNYGGNGGGAGFFGGGGSDRGHGGAAGGSSYVGNDLLISNNDVQKHMTGFGTDEVNTIAREYSTFKLSQSAENVEIVDSTKAELIGKKYSSIGDAITAAGNNTSKIKILADRIYETENENNVIASNQNITIDLNGKEVLFGNGIINAGELKIVDSKEGNTAKVTTQLIENRKNMNIEAGNWTLEINLSYGIDNTKDGTLRIKDSTFKQTSSGLKEDWINQIQNSGTLYIDEGAEFDLETYYYSRAILNYGDLIVNDGTFKNTSNQESKLIENKKDNIFKNSVKQPEGYDERIEEGEYCLRYGEVCIELDLTNKEVSKNYNVSVLANAVMGDGSRCYGIITESQEKPDVQNEDGTFMYISTPEGQKRKEYTTSVQGGKKYYIHLGHIQAFWATSKGLIIDDIKVSNDEETVYEMKHPRTIINNINVEMNKTGIWGYNLYGIVNTGYGSYLEINDGTISSLCNSSTYGIYNTNGEVKISDCTITGECFGLWNRNGDVKIDDISITGTGNTSIVQERITYEGIDGKIEIDNCTLKNGRGIDIKAGDAIVKNGSIQNVYFGIAIANGELTVGQTEDDVEVGVTPGKVSIKTEGNGQRGIYLHGETTTQINNLVTEGTEQYTIHGIFIEGNNNDLTIEYADISGTAWYNSHGIYLTGQNNDILIKDIDINMICDSDNCGPTNPSGGIYNNGSSGGKIEVRSGSIKAKGRSNALATYGIYSNGDVTLIIGKHDEENEQGEVDDTKVHTDDPVIIGTSYGLYKTAGDFDFYDGIIKAEQIKSYSGDITNRPKEYEVLFDTEEGYCETAYLKKLEIAEIQETGVKYYSLQEAFDDCEDNTLQHVNLLYHANLKNITTVDTDKNIVLDLKGYNIIASLNKTMKNNGQLLIKNGLLLLQNSGEKENYLNILENRGKLTIDEDTEFNINEFYYARAILNYNELIINDGTFKSNSANESHLIENVKDNIFPNSFIQGNNLEGDNVTAGVADGDYCVRSSNQGELCIEIDLTEKDTSKEYNVEVVASACMGDGSRCYGIVTESRNIPTIENDNDTFIYMTQSGKKRGKYTTSIQGGKKYYIHLGHIQAFYNTQYGIIVSDVKVSNDEEIIYEVNHSKTIINNIILNQENTGMWGYRVYGLYNVGYGNYIEINDGNISAGTNENTDGIYNINGDIKVANCTIDKEQFGIVNVNGNIEINNINISNTGHTSIVQEKLSYLDCAATLEIDDCTLAGGRGIDVRYGDATVKNGSITEAFYGLMIANGILEVGQTASDVEVGETPGKVYVEVSGNGSKVLTTDGNTEIEIKNLEGKALSGTDTYGINIAGTKNNVIIKNADIETKALYNTYGVNISGTKNVLRANNLIVNAKNAEPGSNRKVIGVNSIASDNSVIEVKGGSIKAEGNEVCEKIYGIYSTGDADIIIGNHDEENNQGIVDDTKVSRVNPEISSSLYGIYKTNGKLDMYDGVIKGKEELLFGSLVNRPKEYELEYSEVDDINIAKLERLDVAEIIGGSRYKTLQDAINACPDNQEKEIKILNDINLPSVLNIAQDKKIKIDLDEHTLTTSREYNIVNNGNVLFKNGNILIGAPGSREQWVNIFENKGVLNLNEDLLVSIDLYGYTRCVLNYGELNVNGANFYANNPYGYDYKLIENRKQEDVNDFEGQINYIDGRYDMDVTDTGLRHAYMEIDLENKDASKQYEIIVNAEIATHEGCYGYSVVTENTNMPNRDGNQYELFDISGVKAREDYSVSVLGGKKYYLHFVYYYNGIQRERRTMSINYIKVSGENEIIYKTQCGKVTINSGKMDFHNVYNTSQNYAIYNLGYGCEVTINDVEITSDYDKYPTCIVNDQGNLVINGGTIKNAYNAITNIDGEVEINNCDISHISTKAFAQTYKDYAPESAKTIINNISISDYLESAIWTQRGEIEINDCDIQGSKVGILLYSYSPKVVMNDGSIDINGAHAIASAQPDGRPTTEAELIIKGGTIKSTENGIYFDRGNNTVTLGDKFDAISMTNPNIDAGKYGIYRTSGTFNFYDGIITGQTEPIYGGVSDTPFGYEEKVNGKTATLGRNAVFQNTIQMNGAYYDTIQSAIGVLNNQTNKTGTIYIWNDIIREDQKFTVPVGMNLTLALEGHVLEINVADESIINNGTLTIVDSDDLDEIDSSTLSIVRNTLGTAIQNNGTLIVGRSDNPNSNSPIITAVTPVSGATPTVLSGDVRVLNVQSGALNIEDGLKVARFNFGGSYSISTTEYNTKNIAKRIYLEAENVMAGVANRILSTATRITGSPELPVYTNDGVDINLDADVIPNLDMYYTDTNVGTVKAKYVDIKSNKVLSENETTDKHGRDYRVDPISIDNYDLVESEIVDGEEVSRLPQNATGTYDALNETEVIYYYVSKATINIKYLDVETNEEIFTADTKDGHEGDSYKVTNRNIDGYMLVTEDEEGHSLLPANAESTFKVTRDENDNIINREDDVIYYYTSKAVGVNVKYVDVVNDSIIYNYHVNGNIGDTYNEPVKTISEVPALQGYNLLEEKDGVSYLPDNAEGTLGDELIEVVYFFVHNYRFEVHYIDEDGNDIVDPILLDTLEGDTYSASAKSIEDYVLKESPTSLTGTLLRDDEIADEDVNPDYGRYFLRLDFVYEPLVVMCDVHVNYVDEVSNKLLGEKTLTGERNTRYETSAITITKYMLDEERIPNNKTGNYSENETIEVTYYYKRIGYVKTNYIDINTNDEVFESEYKEGPEGEDYEVFSKNIDNYILVTEDEEGHSLLPSNATGKYTIVRDENNEVTNDEVEVTYYYTNRMNNIVVKYVDIVHDNEIYNYIVEGILGERYNVEPKTSAELDELQGYSLVEEKDGISYLPDNVEGPVTENGAEIVFYYVHDYRFEVHYVDEEGNDIATPKLLDTLEGETYNELAIEIENKELVGDIDSYSGTLEKDTEISEEDINPVYGRYFLRINFVYKDKETDPEPENETTNVIENEISNEVENEISNEVENEISNEVENEITNEVDNEISNEVDNEITNEVDNEITNEVDNEITNEIDNEITNEIDNEVTNEVENETTNEIPDDKDEKDFKVIVHYIDKATGKKITKDIVIEGKTGEDYLTKIKEITGYELISRSSNYKGQMVVQIVDGKEVKEIHVYYYYAKKASGILPQTGEELMKNALYIIGFIACVSLAIISINKIKNDNDND